MNKEAILSLDIGTTMAKGVVFNLEGSELAIVEKRLSLIKPRVGWVEMNPEEIWEKVLGIIHQLANGIDSDYCIKALSLSTQGGSMVPVKKDGTPSYNLITWLDRRSQPLVDEWERQGIDRRIKQISGWSPSAGLPLCSITALGQYQPDIFRKSARFLSLNDFLAYQLTRQYVTNPSMAGEMLLADIRSGAWNDELCSLAGIQVSQLSTILSSESIIGEILPSVCKAAGLPMGTPLFTGGQDHSCEALALGLESAGDFWLACGSAWVLNIVADIADRETVPLGMCLNFHVLPERWVASQFLGGLGAGFEWWLEQCWQGSIPSQQPSRQAILKSLDLALAKTKPGSSGLFAFPVSGAHHGRSTIQGGFSGLRIDHAAADMGRAIMEGAAFELRMALDKIKEKDYSVKQLWMIGGAAHSAHWPQILADVINIPILLSQYRHGPALGAAILAARGLGFIDDYPNWISAKGVQVNLELTSLYDQRFSAYRSIVEGERF